MDPLDLRIVDLAREFLMLSLVLAAPMLVAGLIVGLAVSLFQALTSIQEQTLSLIPKMLAVLAVALFLLAPSLALLRDYAQRILGELSSFGLS
jgi:flagellar biosynthetic protein FliQ